MKLKAVIGRHMEQELQDEIEVMRGEVMARVIGPHLHRPNFGPAEFYIQRCDFAHSEKAFCEVRLTGVSMTRDRSDKDFDDACEALEALYREKIEETLFHPKQVQLMVSLMLDQPRRDGSCLVERPPIWVEGKRVPTK